MSDISKVRDLKMRALTQCWLICQISAVIITCSTQMVLAQPGQKEIREAVNRGIEYIKSLETQKPEHAGIVAYALLKGGLNKSDPYLQTLLQQIEAKFQQDGTYPGGPHHNYEAATDLMAMEAYDAVKYKPQMTAIVQYLDKNIKSYGAWYYPAGVSNELGDTSITQYALLGLWAAKRAGINVPDDLWIRAGNWHLRTQSSDGLFTYHPTQSNNSPTKAMTMAGLGSLGLIRMMLTGSPRKSIRPERKPAPTKKDSPAEIKPENSSYIQLAKQSPHLIPIEEEQDSDAVMQESLRSQQRPDVELSLSQLDLAIQRGLNAMVFSYDYASGPTPFHRYYYFYTVERTAALHQLKTILNQDWFNDGAVRLLTEQRDNGSWLSGHDGEPCGTCFAILFLVKATGKLVSPIQQNDPAAGGLMAGGRGLPEDLSNMSIRSGEVKVDDPGQTTIASLFDQLQQVDLKQPEQVNRLQQELVDLARMTSRDELVNQWDRIQMLLKSDSAELRQMAAWALGRCEREEAMNQLIVLLDDPDAGVVIEARNSLCWISRQPEGFGHTDTPWSDLPDEANEQKRIEMFEQWRKRVKTDWVRWYYKNRPFEYRDTLDDPEQQKRKNQAR